MKFFHFALLALVTLVPALLWPCEYSEAEKSQIYFKAQMPRPTANMVISISDPKWAALDGPLMVDNINRIGEEESRATVLAASCIEFNYLLQPISNIKILEDRRCMLENLQLVYGELNPLMVELAEVEHVFTHLLDQERKSPTHHHLFQLFFESGIVTVATVVNLPYVARHFAYDWQSIMAYRSNVIWLCAMVCLKIAGTMGGLYKSGEFVLSNAQQIYAKVRKDDKFVMDFSRAMSIVDKIIKIITKNPTLANTLTIFIDFDHSRKLSTGLNDILRRAEKRLQANEGYITALWAAKDSSSLYEEIKRFTQYFKNLYYGLARLDANCAVLRIREDLEKQGLPVTFAQFILDEEKPSYYFNDLRNPLIDDCVANDMSGSNAVLNGPSMCGKTAAMKSISCAYMMGQSILLVYAREAKFVPVCNIGTYFNIGDNIKEGKSSFGAQRLAIKDLLKLAKNQSSGKTFLFIDEPYNAITSDIGEILTVDLIEELLTLPQVTFLLSTHHKKPTEFGEKGDNLVHNWHPELLEKNNDEFIATFKLIIGVARWWYENPEKAMAFIGQLDNQ